jgi:cell division protein FtsA
MSASNVIGVVDVGTCETRVFIAQVLRGRGPSIIGVGVVPTRGFTKGVVVDVGGVVEGLNAAVQAAQRQAGVGVKSVFLGLSGAYLPGRQQVGVVNVSGRGGRVCREDVRRAVGEVLREVPPEGCVRVSEHFQSFQIDGRWVNTPVGQPGRTFKAGYWVVYGRKGDVGTMLHVLEQCSLKVANLIPSSIASGLAVTDEAMRQAGVLVLDVGAGVVDLALYRKGVLVYTDVLPLGGERVSGDLAHGLRTRVDVAEQLKVRNGCALVRAEDARETIWMIGDQAIGDRLLNRGAINKIIHARVHETFDFVRRRLGAGASRDRIGAGVVLTGGGARLSGLAEVASSVLGLDVRVAEVFPEWGPGGFSEPRYSTALGLLLCAAGRDGTAREGAGGRPGFWPWLRRFLT